MVTRIVDSPIIDVIVSDLEDPVTACIDCGNQINIRDGYTYMKRIVMDLYQLGWKQYSPLCKDCLDIRMKEDEA